MVNITEDFIRTFALNQNAQSSGLELAKKGSFEELSISEDGSLLFALCKGSGKNPYSCSADFSEAEPIARCSCPSRQIPCKHVIGLLYCRMHGMNFKTMAVPDDIALKRTRKAASAAKKNGTGSAAPSEMTKAKASAAAKKCRKQLEGISLAKKLLHNIMLGGLYRLDWERRKQLDEQIRELGNYYINGVQAAFKELFIIAEQAQKDQIYTNTAIQVNYLYALLKKGEQYLIQKEGDYSAFPDNPCESADSRINSSVEEQLGYAWKLTELKELGLYKENESLIQLSLRFIENDAKREVAEEGVWLSLNSGRLYRTYNYRPYSAKKHIKEEDSIFQKVSARELFIYPGELNPRVRWEGAEFSDISDEDYIKARSYASGDYAAVIKKVKAQIKDPLADKNPLMLLRIGSLKTGEGGLMSVYDEQGYQIVLHPEMFANILRNVNRRQAEGAALACRFVQDTADGTLYAVPAALIDSRAVIRLYY